MIPNGFNRYRLSVFVLLKTTVSRASWSGACGSVEVIDHGSKGKLNHLEQVCTTEGITEFLQRFFLPLADVPMIDSTSRS